MITFTFALGSTAYAADNNHKGKLKRHTQPVYAAVKERLNITDTDLKNAKEKGKTAFNLAKEKNVSADELRAYITLKASQALDKEIEKGVLPKFIGKKIKYKVGKSIENWDGCFN